MKFNIVATKAERAAYDTQDSLGEFELARASMDLTFELMQGHHGVGRIEISAYNLTELADVHLTDTTKTMLKKLSSAGILYDSIENDGENPENGVVYSEVVRELLPKLINQTKRNKLLATGNVEDDVWIVVVERFYINAKYRHKGLSHYLHENLHNLIRAHFGINAIASFGILCPETENANPVTVETQEKPYLNDYSILSYDEDVRTFASFLG